MRNLPDTSKHDHQSKLNPRTSDITSAVLSIHTCHPISVHQGPIMTTNLAALRILAKVTKGPARCGF